MSEHTQEKNAIPEQEQVISTGTELVTEECTADELDSVSGGAKSGGGGGAGVGITINLTF